MAAEKPRRIAAAPVRRAEPPQADAQAHPSPTSTLAALPSIAAPAASTAAPAATFAADPAPIQTLPPKHDFLLVPWLLAALALGAGGAFLFFRRRERNAFAGGPQVDAFVAPTPAPAPRPAPAPPAAAPESATPATTGIVSTRLRPWIEIGFQPVRCVLDSAKVTVDFEIELFNSGSAAARAVLVEASLFNAGADQDSQIASFFASPAPEGDRIDIIPPLQRFALRTQVNVPLDQVQAYELAGRRVFLPLIAFNAFYAWSSGDGQTSASYLLGRDTKGEKLGPFRLDLGPRIFRGIGARVLPAGIRR
jgi:hypothetical protein